MMDPAPEYSVVGMMSGTSLDGMDLACCRFHFDRHQWKYRIHHATTIPYSRQWKEKLLNLPRMDEAAIDEASISYGELIAGNIIEFIAEHHFHPQFISVHGHTIFHDPGRGLTLQIGDGRAIAMATGVTVIHDFRSQDVRMGGQGAPLVPVGDRLLFNEYDYCLNLGGFANISYEKDGRRVGFDIGPCNLVFNHLSKKLGKDFDEGGRLSSQGQVIDGLLESMNSLPYYSLQPPKSLGKEWLEDSWMPILVKYGDETRHLMRTFTEHLAIQVAASIEEKEKARVLATGGGAYNKFLIERIKHLSGKDIIVPDDLTVQYKEALIFALLGVLRIRNEINVLGSVTGAPRDHSAGTICYPDH